MRKSVENVKLQEYNDIFDKIVYFGTTRDFRGIERLYWKLKHLTKSKRDEELPVIEA